MIYGILYPQIIDQGAITLIFAPKGGDILKGVGWVNKGGIFSKVVP